MNGVLRDSRSGRGAVDPRSRLAEFAVLALVFRRYRRVLPSGSPPPTPPSIPTGQSFRTSQRLARSRSTRRRESGARSRSQPGPSIEILVAGGARWSAPVDQPTSLAGALQGILAAPTILAHSRVSAAHVGNNRVFGRHLAGTQPDPSSGSSAVSRAGP